MISSPTPDPADDRAESSPSLNPEPDRLVPQVPKGVERSEPRRISASRTYPRWLPYLLFFVLGILGVGLVSGGTIAYNALTDPGHIASNYVRPREVKFSRWTLAAIGTTCTIGSLLVAHRIEND
ncbi:MAG: hypothetical protein SWY16_12590 [Cyanobacteriota bacterium]|nr:hypothetical protein [Cyanobacteriota bacterium]